MAEKTHWPCDLCGEDSPIEIEAARPFVGDNDVPCVCGNCGFCYIPDRRAPSEIAAAWDDLWSPESYTSAWPAVMARLTYVIEWIHQNIGLNNKAVLDIGAGEGTFLGMARRKGATVTGIEPCADNVQRIMGNGIRCEHGTVESVELDDKFDIVTVLWTLENTGDCIGFLKKARTFLKKDGRLVVATGSRILVPFKKPMSMYFSKNPADTHCFRFSANTLAAAFIRAGIHPARTNRHFDSDWLVMSGQCVLNIDEPPTNNPKDVLAFFDEWARMWP